MTYDKELTAYKSAAHMVRKTKQVVILYEGAIRFMQQARIAIEAGEHETKYNALTKAGEIIIGMQCSLDFDNGGEVAQILYDYYAGLDMRIMLIHQNNKPEECDLIIKLLKMMCDAWKEVDDGMASEEAAEVVSAAPEEEESENSEKNEESASSSQEDDGDEELSNPFTAAQIEETLSRSREDLRGLSISA